MFELCRRGETVISHEYIKSTCIGALRIYAVVERCNSSKLARARPRDDADAMLAFAVLSKWRYRDQRVFDGERDLTGKRNWCQWRSQGVMHYEQSQSGNSVLRRKRDKRSVSGMCVVELIGGCPRRKPAAALAFAWTLDCAQRLGFDGCLLDVQTTESFHHAISFYTKYGFREALALDAYNKVYTQGYKPKRTAGGALVPWAGTYKPNFFYYRSGVSSTPLLTLSTVRVGFLKCLDKASTWIVCLFLLLCLRNCLSGKGAATACIATSSS
jgi:hypothetical protein